MSVFISHKYNAKLYVYPNLNISARMSGPISESLKPFKNLSVVYYQA